MRWDAPRRTHGAKISLCIFINIERRRRRPARSICPVPPAAPRRKTEASLARVASAHLLRPLLGAPLHLLPRLLLLAPLLLLAVGERRARPLAPAPSPPAAAPRAARASPPPPPPPPLPSASRAPPSTAPSPFAPVAASRSDRRAQRRRAPTGRSVRIRCFSGRRSTMRSGACTSRRSEAPKTTAARRCRSELSKRSGAAAIAGAISGPNSAPTVSRSSARTRAGARAGASLAAGVHSARARSSSSLRFASAFLSKAATT